MLNPNRNQVKFTFTTLGLATEPYELEAESAIRV